MSACISCISLPVKDLAKSLAFYRDGIGFPCPDINNVSSEDDHVALTLKGGMYLVLLLNKDFESFTRRVNQDVATPTVSECILSYFAASKAEVNEILQRCKLFVGVVDEPHDQAWGYGGLVADPDGHIWEVMYNPNLIEKSA